MTNEQIKTAIANGQKVYWQNDAYEVRITKLGDLQTVCKINGSVQFLQDTKGIYTNPLTNKQTCYNITIKDQSKIERW